MKQPDLSWVTMHRSQFSKPLKNTDITFSGPAKAGTWRCGPDSDIAEHGFRSGYSDVWAGLGFYSNRPDAEHGLGEALAELAFGAEADEAWCGLFAIIAHRGELDLSQKDDPHPNIVPLSDDPTGVLAVMTSAGYSSFSESDHGRMRDFIAKIEDVRAFYATLDSNIVTQIFEPVGTPDGLSFTIWKEDPAMLHAAYKDGTHRAMLDRHKSNPMFDRSSFTRMRLLDSRGSWGGIDPLAA